MVMGVAGKVGGMAGSAGAASASVHRGIAMAVDAGDAGAVFWGMAEAAGVFMHRGDDVAGVAVDAEGGRSHSRRMAMGV